MFYLKKHVGAIYFAEMYAIRLNGYETFFLSVNRGGIFWLLKDSPYQPSKVSFCQEKNVKLVTMVFRFEVMTPSGTE